MSLKRLKKNLKETKPAIDTHKAILIPLDYSFKALGDFSGEWINQDILSPSRNRNFA